MPLDKTDNPILYNQEITPSMSYAAGNPLVEIWVTGWRKEAAIRLLTRYCWLGWSLALSLLFHGPPMVQLPLLPIVHQKNQRGRQPDDDQALNQPFVYFIVEVVAARHRVLMRRGVCPEIVVVAVVIVRVLIFEKVGDPFAEGPVFLRFCASVSLKLLLYSMSEAYQAQIGWN